MSKEVESRYFVEAAAKALDVLESFNGLDEELTTSEIVRRVGLTYCSAFRLLYTLEKRGYVMRTEGAKRFRLTPTRKRFRIGYAALGRACAHSQEISRGMVLAARALGVDLIFRDNGFSPPKALAHLDSFLEERVHLIVMHQWSDSAAEVIAARCRKAGVPLVALDFLHPDAYYFGNDDAAAGKLSGQFLREWCQQQGERPERVIVIPPRGTSSNRQAYLTGVRGGLQGWPGGSPPVEAVPADGHSSSDAYRTARAALQREPKAGSTLIAAGADAYAIGSGRAAAKAGAIPDIAIIGQGGGYAIRNQLLRGGPVRATVATFPETYGDHVISLALRIFEGEPVARINHPEPVLLTPSNVREYYPNPSNRAPRGVHQDRARLNAVECAS
ncbi:MAG: substrate-binding domain-containing protein [Acidobacteria bacterium]|nr:substrate-binding domain-containing protein [Acidobacteriota bacterium]